MKSANKDMSINELIDLDKGIVSILLSNGMHCIGCPMSMRETLAEAGFVHGQDVDMIVDEINDYLEAVSYGA